MNKIILTFVAAFAAVTASAATFEQSVAEGMQPFILEDSFAHVEACRIVDAVTIRPWTLEEARDLVAPCAKAVSDKYSNRIDVETGFVVSGEKSLPGLIFRTGLKPGSKQHRDLLVSVERRGGKLLGHTVKILASGEFVPPAQATAVQAAMSRCIMVTAVRDVRSGEDFVTQYGKCLLRDEELGLSEVRAARGMAVVLKTKKPAVAETLTGFVTVLSSRGPVSVMMIGQSAEAL